MSVEKYYMSWDELYTRLDSVDKPDNIIYGIPRGGMIVSAFLKYAKVAHEPMWATMIIDDIVDSGRTRDKWMEKFPEKEFYAIVDKKNNPSDESLGWVVFPFEDDKDTDKEDNAIRLLEHYGKNTTFDNVEKILKFVEGIDE